MPRPSLLLRFLRAAGAALYRAPLEDGSPDPTGRACVLQHPAPAGSGLPDISWWAADITQLEASWRQVAAGWQARAQQAVAVRRIFEGASSGERARMVEWQALAPEAREGHAWHATAQQIGAAFSVDRMVLERGWRARSARFYIQSLTHEMSEDYLGDAIVECMEANVPVSVNRPVQRPKR